MKTIQITYFRPSAAAKHTRKNVRNIASFMLVSLMLPFTDCDLAK